MHYLVQKDILAIKNVEDATKLKVLKLKSVKSVVDTSPPTGYGEKHNVRHSRPPSRASKHRQSMSTDRLCTSSFCLSDFTNDLPRLNRSHSVPPRPPTRRKHDSAAQDLFRLRSSDPPKRDCTCPHKSRSPRSQHCNKCSPSVDTLAQYIETSAAPPTPAPRTKTPRMDDVVKDSISEHEYLQFSLRITEDIIRNDLYTNKDMRRVFNSHLEANRGRLDMAKMLEQIQKLSVELNIPLDTGKDCTQTRRNHIKASQQTLKNNLACRPCSVKTELLGCSVKSELLGCECGSMRALPLQRKRPITCPSELSTAELQVIKVNSQAETPSRPDSIYAEYFPNTSICAIPPLDKNYFYYQLAPSNEIMSADVRPSLATSALPLVPLEVTLSRITEKTEVTTSTETGFEQETNKEKCSEAVPIESNASEGDYSINFKEFSPASLESSPPQGNKDMPPLQSQTFFKPPEFSFLEKPIQTTAPSVSSSVLQDVDDLDVTASEQSNDALVQSENKPQVSQTNIGSPIESTVNQVQSLKDSVPPSDYKELTNVSRTCPSPNQTKIESPKDSVRNYTFKEITMTYVPKERMKKSPASQSKEPTCVVNEPTVTYVSYKPKVTGGHKMKANKTYPCCLTSPNLNQISTSTRSSVPTEFVHANQPYSSQNANPLQSPIIGSVKSCSPKQSFHSCGNSVYSTVSSEKSTHEIETQTPQPPEERCCDSNLCNSSKPLKMKNDMQGQKKSENNESKYAPSTKSLLSKKPKKTLSVHNASSKLPTTPTSPQSINCTQSEPIQSAASLVSLENEAAKINVEATAAPTVCNESINTQINTSPTASKTVSNISQVLGQVFTIPCKCKEKENPQALPFNQNNLEQEYILIPGPIYVPKSSITPFHLFEKVSPSPSNVIPTESEYFFNSNYFNQALERPSVTASSFQSTINFPTAADDLSSCIYSIIQETAHYNSLTSNISTAPNIPTGTKITESLFRENLQRRLTEPPRSMLNFNFIEDSDTMNNILTQLNDYDLTPQRDENRNQHSFPSISGTIHQPPDIFVNFNNENLLLGDKYEIKENSNDKSDSSDNGIPLSIRQFFPDMSTQTRSSDFLLVPSDNLSYEKNSSESYIPNTSLSNFLRGSESSRSLNQEKDSNKSSNSSSPSFRLVARGHSESEAISQVQYVEDQCDNKRESHDYYVKEFDKIRRRNTEITCLGNYVEDEESHITIEDDEKKEELKEKKEELNEQNEDFNEKIEEYDLYKSVSDNFKLTNDQQNHTNNKESGKSLSSIMSMETQTDPEQNQLASSQQLLDILFEEPQQETEVKRQSEPRVSTMSFIEEKYPERHSHDRQHWSGKMGKRFETQLHHLGDMERVKVRDQQRWQEELDELEVKTLDLNSQEGDASEMSVPKLISKDNLKERNSLQQNLANDWQSLTPGELQQELILLEYANINNSKSRPSVQPTGDIMNKSSIQLFDQTSARSITSTPVEKFVMFQSENSVLFEPSDGGGENENQQIDLEITQQDDEPSQYDRHRPSMMKTINEVRSNLEKFRTTQVEGSARERFNLPGGTTNRKDKIAYSSTEEVPIIEIEKSDEHIDESNEDDVTSECCGLKKPKKSKRRDLIEVERSQNNLLNISSLREQFKTEAESKETERGLRFDTSVESGVVQKQSIGFQYESLVRKAASQRQLNIQADELDDVERDYIEQAGESDDDRRLSEYSGVYTNLDMVTNNNSKATPSVASSSSTYGEKIPKTN